ncbi:hypothetical protein [Micromonospora sp. b486]|uniref:hypothetical protein n=1 Tax=Micromonospora sp. b486 TaxID=3053986 RepID=UPI00259C9970|nr:hypothetical protein [Micromonospora sp. b486]MDM4784682.1 hypothetical protein [Micromonospora sp. b486]
MQAVAGILRHRCAVHNWLGAAYRPCRSQWTPPTASAPRCPGGSRRGEVVSIGTADIEHIGGAIDITARGAASGL